MAEIKINENQWNAVSADEQRKIIDGLRSTGALQPDDVIVGDPSVPEITEETVFAPMWNPLKDLCKAGCDIAAAAALAWCTANTAGVGLAACIAAAELARAECKRRC